MSCSVTGTRADFEKMDSERLPNCPLKEIIDNTETVEKSEIWGEGFADGLAIGAKWVERSKGEWKRITEETANVQMFLCSVCGRKVEVGYSHISPSVYYPFCHCGADMRTEDK